MTNSGRDESGGPRRHRRTDPDDLTLDDIFRPESSPQPHGGHQQPTLYPSVPQQHQHMPSTGEPWQSPVPQHLSAPGTGPYATPGAAFAGAPGSGGQGAPQQGMPWGALGAQPPTGAHQPPSQQGGPQPHGGLRAAPDTPPPGVVPQYPAAPAEETQILPPYPAAAPHSAEGASAAGHQDGGGSDAAETQVLPAIDAQGPYTAPGGAPGATGPAPYQPHLPATAASFAGGSRPSAPSGPRTARRAAAASNRRLSPVALAGIVVAACAVAGLVAGAALSSDDDGDEGSRGTSLPKAGATASGTPSPSQTPADPAEEQARALSELLKDSNSSRSSVINAVEQIRVCKNLDAAARTLRDAAAQRNNLVARLAELSVDRLENHKQLTASLNKAWASSAAADNYYASWADDVAGKKGCKKGRARVTANAQRGNAASGQATRAKREAARLWNAVADEYGLPRRTAVQI